ncbi:MAG: NAD(P)-dependent oxidoreductase [Breznakia sp.]
MKIAWIGCGVMGKPMAIHLAKAQYEVHVYNRTYEKIKDMDGVIKHTSIRDCIKNCDVIFTIVGFPRDVDDVYFSDKGIIKNAKKGALLIDMTTSSPALAVKIAQNAKDFEVLDAPVSGGDKGAQDATLTIMVGGNETSFKKAFPLFKILGKTITYIGQHGSGQHCKMCNQIAIAGAISAMSEALVYADAHHMDTQRVLQAIANGSAQSWQMTNMAPRVLQNDFDPGFYIKHFVKDMRLAKEEIATKEINLHMLNSVYHMFHTLENEGYGDLGTQALLKFYDKQKG